MKTDSTINRVILDWTPFASPNSDSTPLNRFQYSVRDYPHFLGSTRNCAKNFEATIYILTDAELAIWEALYSSEMQGKHYTVEKLESRGDLTKHFEDKEALNLWAEFYYADGLRTAPRSFALMRATIAKAITPFNCDTRTGDELRAVIHELDLLEAEATGRFPRF